MHKLYFFIAFSVLLVIAAAQTSQAAFLYSKPEFCGRVIDSETKEPIAGAVVVILYYKRSTFSLNPGGPSSFVTKAKETLTDKNGEFFFHSYSELMWLNEDVGARFIFFKPGYQAGYGPSYIAPLLTEKYFSAGEIAKEVEIEAGSFNNSSYVKWKGPLGIVELKKARTREEKLRTMPSPPANYTSKELPILIKFINSEINNLGLKGEYK
ncbi:MAG: carboxypeptidase-like regulatory domain-containing protein [Deltaproteobacteria bacterium]|nr:carboxypeptidase-like regulatory domain-containing protein [Deltaproteobacteria bacterium]